MSDMEFSENDDDSEHNYIDESDAEYKLLQMVQTRVALYANHFIKHSLKEPCRTSHHSGHSFVLEVLNGHKDRIHQQFRMEKHVFIKLCQFLSESYGLKSGKNIFIIESVAMFFITLSHAFGNRMTQEKFQHSGKTISRWFGIVLDAVFHMAIDLLKPSDPQFKEIPKKIRNDDRYWPYFKDCIRAIDGTHILVIVPTSKQIPYIERKRDSYPKCDGRM
ncbi:uncharacterized protein LOC127900978 [Citrus sinensis]|uniref:uncharacterized protein LOC127900978 n=1 Tax=Citrus sinensis TaxID=2711 RepID=UPI002277D392|nr:uncharacterized protein LOC127900978 [Citrus sinensis]